MFFRRKNQVTAERPVLRAEAVQPGRRSLLAWGCACCVMATLPVFPAGAAPAEVQRHLDAAKAAAGSDLGAYLKLGDAAVAPAGDAATPSLAQLINQPVPPPGQVFDNLYFVGAKWVSAWIIKTSDGLILIDALNNDDEAERVIGGGMKALGLDPAQIKLVLVTHGHGDHYGGIGWVQRVASPRVGLAEADWHMMETKLEFDAPEWGRPPKRDLVLADGQKVVLGDTAVEIFVTPGHTPGTVTLLFEAKDGGQTHRVLLWGGTGFNFGKRPDRVARMQSYVDGTARLREVARQRDVDVFISNHSGFDEAVTKLAAKQAGQGNPFVIGTGTTVRALTVMNECAQATKLAWQA
ncbi:MBL fold metallo-hydrolase [Acetobacteraceae bacterium H6797]|nr:MBL fold metallo-hydrolase [Acetobacteraceae bacterium H6797]